MGNCCRNYFLEPPKSNSTQLPKPIISPSDFVRVQEIHSLQDLYSVEEVIGEGGFGRVTRVSRKETGAERACKTVNLKKIGQQETEKLLNEVEILKSLDHPNITKIYDVFRENNKLHIIQELCCGGDLFDKIMEKGFFSENRAAMYMLDIVSAVMHCHERGIVHRDIKPENILLESSDPNSRVKVIDFGTSVHFRPNEKMKEIIGTSYYMAPELLQGNYNEKCDVWSCGVILYILLSGIPPFNGRSDSDIRECILDSDLNFSGEIWKFVSKEARKLLGKMLKKNPKKRPSIQEVFNDPWLQTHGRNVCPDTVFEGEYLKNLAAFNVQNELQRATMSYIVSNLLTKEETHQVEQVFRALDENGDGKLSREEIEKGLSQAEHLKINANEVIEQCDTDGNGFISYSEFLTAAVNWEKVLSKDKLKRAFEKFDKNKDGKISLQELEETIGNEQLNNTKLLEILKEADSKGDGEIDLEEFSSMMLQRVNS